MKYAHLADLHLGSWRDQKMRDLSTAAFNQAIDRCIEQKVDFILFAGDLFNTSLPSLDILKIITKKLKELQDRNISIYVIPGSHDFSPSGKTMIDVLENAGLLINVCKGTIDEKTKQLNLKFTTDQKTKVKITGLLGRKGQLDRSYYENLFLEPLENEPGYKIFMFHTTLTELKPKELERMESHPVSFLPKGFDYYAGGHVHEPVKIDVDGYGPLTYTGALFPNNFAELEKYGQGGYYIIEVDDDEREKNGYKNTENSKNNNNNNDKNYKYKTKITWQPLKVAPHYSLILDANNKNPENITTEIISHFENEDIKGSLITIRLYGKMKDGRISDIDFKDIFERLYRQGAYFVMKNTLKLTTEEFSEIKIAQNDPQMIEEEIIKEHLQQFKIFDKDVELSLTRSLLDSLNITKNEGETMIDFQKRIESEFCKLLDIETDS